MSSVQKTIQKEESTFRQTLRKGVEHIHNLKHRKSIHDLTGDDLFFIYETFGFPLEMSLEEFNASPKDADRLESEFNKAFKRHQEVSRAGMTQKFKSGLSDNSEVVVAYHTVAHLLLSACKKVLAQNNTGEVHQAGQNITGERLRYDISLDRKIDEFELAKIEEMINFWISQDLKVLYLDLPKDFALQIGAETLFKQKYDDVVRVYFIYDSNLISAQLLTLEVEALKKYFEKSGNLPADLVNNSKIGSKKSIISKEFCAGPHVEKTSDVSKFGTPRIVKTESSGSGVRRIRVEFS
jgi:alanyl-tRNA synthetase